mgnify:CR=1 FL=1
MNPVDQYQEVFKTDYNFNKEELRTHIEKFKELDKYLPPSSTYLIITNTREGKYEFISKNFEPATGLSSDPFMENGISYYLTLIHPDEIQTWLLVLSELMNFCTTEFPIAKLNRLDFQYNYRFRVKGDGYLNVLENQVNLLADQEGRPVVGLGHFTVFGNGDELPIRASVRYLNDQNEYETVFYKVYGAKLLQESISNRERDVLRLIALGYDNDTIADKLFVSPHTVKTHRKNMLSKTGSKNSMELIVQCIKEGII